ncbi:MAG: AsmA family protein [Acidobacteriota bacterium]
MRLRKKTLLRLALAAVALVAAVGLIVPLVDAGRFSTRVKTSLSAALGREVEIGKVRLDLFNGPGFSVDRVVVREDPRVGIEPFAYVESLEARVSLASLWTGRLEFSNLRLVNASINLTRPEGGHWNFESLPGPAQLPAIEVRGGRINFKFGNTKSIFYLAEARLDASASPSGEWRLEFEGEPARTDRGSQGFGRFTMRGQWRPGRAPGGEIDGSIEIENGSLSDLMRLAHGHDIGVHGRLTSRARLSGPLSNIAITGRMQIGDIHRWDLLPPHGGGWPLDFHGTLDLVGQELRLETARTLPVSLQFRATGFLSRPRWASLITLDRLPFAPLPEVARHMGLELPEALAVTGELTGVIGYSPESLLQGKVAAGETTVTIPDGPPLRFRNAQVRLDREKVHLEPAAFEAGTQTATGEGEYTWAGQAWSARITAAGMELAGAERGARLLGAVPLVEHCTAGTWTGQLDYRKDGEKPGAWTGAFRLENASIPVEGLADPVELVSARVALGEDGAVVDRIEGRAGPVAFKGDYRYAAANARPHRLTLRIPALDAAELERLLMPTLRREETLFARALRLGRTRVPQWLEARRAEAAVEIGSMQVKGLPLENVRAHVRWDGTTVEATDLAARFEDGQMTGRLTANLRRSAPAYRMNVRLRGVEWMGGKWDSRSLVQSSGTGLDVMRNLRLEGSFKARSVELAGEAEARDVSGTYAFAMNRGLPTFEFSDLLLTLGESLFKGKGATGPDGRVYFDLSDGQTQMRMNATVWPFHLEMASRNPGTL